MSLFGYLLLRHYDGFQIPLSLMTYSNNKYNLIKTLKAEFIINSYNDILSLFLTEYIKS